MPASSDPFAPRPHRPKEPTNNARLPVGRLKALGVPGVVIAEAERRWAGAGPTERAEARDMFDAATDDELRQDSLDLEFALAVRAAGAEPGSEAPLDAMDRLNDALEQNRGTVEAALAWVHEDEPAVADRALAMLVAERRRGDSEQRKTLLEPLEAKVRGGADGN